jgi:ABC-2 type transport system ATP-binding protein
MDKAASEALIELHDVTKAYRSCLALENVSLSIGSGITGLLGPNGAGKSTLIKVMLGLVSVTSGSGRILDLPFGTNYKTIRQFVGYMPEDDCYISGLSGVEMVRFVARLSGMPSTEALRRAHEILDFCGVEQERYRFVETYSTGMRQKLKFAQAIVHDPPLLILDEPTSGLDPRERQIMLGRIRSLAERSGKTVLISTHILPDVQSVCDHVVILAYGRVRISERFDVLAQPVQPAYQVRVLGDAQEFIRLVQREGLQIDQARDGTLNIQGMNASTIQRIWRWAEQAGVGIRLLRPAKNSLDEIFVQAVRREQDAGS